MSYNSKNNNNNTDNVSYDISVLENNNKLIEKLAKSKARLVFLLKCRRSDIIPRFIMDKVRNLQPTFQQPSQIVKKTKAAIEGIKKTLLNSEIGQCCYVIKQLEQQLESNVVDANSTFIHGNDASSQYQENLNRHNKRLFLKFDRLKREQPPLSDIHLNKNFIKNISGEVIPYEMLVLLSMGPKFALPPTDFPTFDVITDVEHIARGISNDEKIQKRFRGEMGYSITKYVKSNRRVNRIHKFLLKASKITKKFLKEHPDIMITNSDKGSITVISTKADYFDKMNRLNDRSNFELLPEDPTVQCQDKNNRLIGVLKKKQFITENEASRLTTYTANPPRLFGQIKVHKDGYPVRPIVSTVNTAANKLSRFLARILRSAFSRSKYNLKNSQQFVRNIRKIDSNGTWKMVSFDVVNCFGNIPVELALEIIERKFDEKIKQHTNIPKKMFMNLLRFCLIDCNYFTFDGKIYRQLFGLFMGSPLAPILVELVLESVVNHTIELVDFEPEIWNVYVDDHFTIIPEDKIQSTLDILNSVHETVKFTVEIEHNNRIDFLDTTVIRADDGKLKTQWFSKPIASNRILNFYSSHPRYMIENVAKSLIRRALSLTHKCFYNVIIDKMKLILERNNFSKYTIEKLITCVRGKIGQKLNDIGTSQNDVGTSQGGSGTSQNEHQSVIGTSQNEHQSDVIMKQSSYPFLHTVDSDVSKDYQSTITQYRGLAYIPELSETISKTVANFDSQIKIAPRPPYKLSTIFTKTKDKIPQNEKSGVVYKIPCADCDKIYIGETIQKLGTRVKQHQNSCKTIKDNNNLTALAKHHFDYQHSFDFTGVKILVNENNKNKLRVQEVNQIVVHENQCCNYKKDSRHVTPAFYNLMKQHT